MEERGEEVGPNVGLEVWVYKVAAIQGAADGGRGEIGINGWDQVFFGGEGTGFAVGDDSGGVKIASETSFY